MLIGAPWGLLGLLAIPAILLIHLFRRRFRPRPVSALFLYAPQSRTPVAGRRRHRLVRSASLLAELAAVLAATWYLSDPHLDDRRDARHVVAVLDARARLCAVDAAGTTAYARARTALDAALAGLGRDDRVTLIASGVSPRVLCGPAARPLVARDALAGWTPGEPWHDLDPALALARQLAGAGGELLLVSDREPAGLDPDIGVLAVGAPAPTSGLVDARWIEDGDGERIAARVLALGGPPRGRELALRDDGGLVRAHATLALEPGRPALALITPPKGLAPGTTLELVLLGDDAYPPDDRAVVLKPPPRAVRVRVEPGAGAWRPALLHALAAVPDAVIDDAPTATGAAHLVIGEDAATAALGTWRLRIVAGDAPPALGPFLARAGHPLLAEVDFTGALWTGGARGAVEGETLLAAGDAALLVERRRPQARELELWCDLKTANLARHPGWPALIANLVAARRRALPGVDQPNLPLGEPTTVQLPPGYAAVELQAPDGARARLVADSDGEVVLPGLQQAGIHRLALVAAPDAPAVDDWARIDALALDPRLADLAEARSAVRAPRSGGRARLERSRGTLEHLLPIVAAALLCVAAWHAFGREEGAA